MVANTVEICTTAPLRYLLINVKAIDLEKVPLSDMQNLMTVNTFYCCLQVFSL